MFIDFEGIDGSGKTTLSNRLAQRLSKLGYQVVHAREGGELKSGLARRVRELTRDNQILEMSAKAEFFLNLARDAQQLQEVVKPALDAGALCISDRYVYSQLALSGAGRGLPEQELLPAAQLATGGLWPDLVVLVDVDPDVARLRKRLGKLSTGATSSDSRKGLAGAGLAVRVREKYLQMAKADPSRWLVVENTDQPLWVVEQAICDAVLARLEGREVAVRPVLPPRAARQAAPVTLENVEDRFFGALDALEQREPALAAYLLGGIPGLAAHQRRLSYLESFPALVAHGLAGVLDEESFELRDILKALVPEQVALSLPGPGADRALELKEELYARAPAAVLKGLAGDDSARAWRLRQSGLGDRLIPEVLWGLSGVKSREAWELRELGVRRKLYADVARSLTGVAGDEADALRELLFRHERVAVLKSLTRVDSPLSRQLREAYFERAPKVVLRSLAGLEAPYAFALRERGAPLTKEAIDSLDGLAHERAWALREQYAARWPATVASSVKRLPLGGRARALLTRLLSDCGDRLAVLRNAYCQLARAERLGARAGSPSGAEAH